MDSALRPRDIQARIRAGESLEDVARAAGAPIERVEVFAAPVIAEREHVAGLAQIHPVRRRGETTSHRTLRNAVADSLAQRGVDADGVRWDAWKLEDRRWQVLAAFGTGELLHEALFVYDQSGRFSTAANDDARRLIGDDATSPGTTPGRRPATRTSAPGLVDDELAIVRALQGPAGPAPATDAMTPAEASSPSSASDAEDAYLGGELTEVDGVYDIVPAEASQLDVLYDMLSSFDEDSVKIYAGLVHSEIEDTGVIIDAPRDDVPDDTPQPVARAAAEPGPGVDVVTGDASSAQADAPEDASLEGDLTAAENTIAIRPLPPRTPPAADPEQPSLIADGEVATPVPKKPARRRRASVPSWDEIMFGSPHRDA